MTFSIVIPTYNGADYVEQALKSVLCQTRPADEIIISDDNSSDNTLEICQKYLPQIKIFQTKSGPSGFVNGWHNAIAHATGEYISILHQDDLLDPTFLEEIEKAARQYPDVKHLFAPCRYINGKGDVIREPHDYCSGKTYRYTGQQYANAYVFVKNHIHRCPGVVTHRDIFKVCNYREIAGHIADDDFFLRVGNYTDVVGVLKPLASYREHEGSETGHLSFLKINRRLLRDYHFQLTHTADNPLLSNDIIEIFKRWEVEYIHRLFIFGIKNGELKYTAIALRYWGYFCRGEGFTNLAYDIKSVGKFTKNLIRRLHYNHLTTKTKRLVEAKFDSSPVLIVAPHPDDEVIGCGGLIARLVREGRPPHVVVMTGGEGSHAGCCATPATEIVEARRGLTRNAARLLGLPEENIHELDYPDGSIAEGLPQEDALAMLIARLKPKTILVPHWGEGWPDHVKTARIVKRLAPPEAEIWEYCVWMWYYNVWRGLDWAHARALHLTPEEHRLKLQAVDAYITPKAPCGHPWSGVLPRIFIQANTGTTELYFKVR